MKLYTLSHILLAIFISSSFNSEVNKKLSPEEVKSFTKFLTSSLSGRSDINTAQFNISFDSPPQVSIIIPIYNKEKYLPQALRSIQYQSLKNIEILCVDDYSSDNSVKIIKDFQKADNRIKLIKNPQNRGTLYTRINGMLQSRGEYIFFLDPDDMLCNENILLLSYSKAKKNNFDFVQFKITTSKYDEKNKKFTNWEDVLNPKKKYDYLPQPQVFLYYLSENPQGYLFNKLIKGNLKNKIADFIGKDIYSKHCTLWDDGLITFAVNRLSNNFTFLDEFGYWYYINDDSVNNNIFLFTGNKEKDKKNNKKIGDALLVIESIFNWTEEIPQAILLRMGYLFFIQTYDSPMLQLLPLSDHFDKILKLCDRMMNWKHSNKEMNENYVIKYKNNLIKYKSRFMKGDL